MNTEATRLTPADQVERDEAGRRLKHVRRYSVQIVPFTRHPEVIRHAEMDFKERQKPAPRLQWKKKSL